MPSALPRIQSLYESDPPSARTEIRPEDQAILRRERLLAAAERIAKLGSWELDVATQRMRWSDQLYELYGVPNDGDEPPLDVALAYVHRNDVARVRSQLKDAIAEGRGCSCEARIVRPGGEVRHVAMHLEVVLDRGRVVRLIGVTQDVTERVKVMSALQESERRFQIVAAATRDILWDWDIRKNKVWFSDSLQTLGHSDAEHTVEWWAERLHPDDADEVVKSLQVALADDTSTWSAEYRFQRADGTYAHVLDRAGIVRDASGVPARMIGSMQDISARKEAERQREELVGKLEDANKALADFAYVVSHDLKAPLRGIGSLADWIARDQRDRLDDEGKEQIDLLRGRVKRMNDMIEGILRYSRVGRTQAERTTVDVRELIDETVDLLAPPPSVAVKLVGDFPTIRAARTLLAQVFQNLIGNAIKFCDKEEGAVLVSCTPREDDWLFEIMDNGPGIEERHFERIFQLFQTLSPKPRGDSTGVGLSIVKKIVESEGGRIWVDSRVGEGSRFSFTIPKAAGRAR